MKRKESGEQATEEMEYLNGILSELKKYQADNPFDKSRISANWRSELVRQQFTLHPHWIPQRAAVVYFGSMLYGDPKKNDIDLIYASILELPAALVQSLQEEVKNTFSSMKISAYDVIFANLETIEKHARIKKVGAEEKQFFQLNAFEAACALSGKALFPFHEQFVGSFQSEIKKLASLNPLFRREIMKNLHITLQRRKLRRGLPK